MTPPPKAYLFDLGNVLIDIDFAKVLESWAKSAGCEPQPLADKFGPDEAYRRHERGEISAQEYFAHLRPTLGIDISDEAFLQGWNAIFLGERRGIRDALATAASRAPLYAFSNTNAAHQAFWAPAYAPMLEVFERVFVSSELGLRKPDTQAYEAVISAMGMRPEDILFFDDTPENIVGAQAVGLHTVLVAGLEDVTAAL